MHDSETQLHKKKSMQALLIHRDRYRQWQTQTQRNTGALCCSYRFGVGPKCGVDEDGAGGRQRHPAADRAEPCSISTKKKSEGPTAYAAATAT